MNAQGKDRAFTWTLALLLAATIAALLFDPHCRYPGESRTQWVGK